MRFLKVFSSIAIITLLTQILMMIRSMIMAKYFGVSPNMDAFNLANVLTISVFSIISATITTILIPLLSKNKLTLEQNQSIYTFNTFLLIISILFLLVFILFGNPLISIFTKNFDSEIESLTLELTVILACFQVFKVFTGISTAYMQTHNDFVTPKLATLFSVFISLIYFILVDNPNIRDVTLILGISFLIESIYLFFVQKRMRIKIKIAFKIKNNTFKKLVRNTIPILLSSAVFQISIIFSNFIAGFFGAGHISILGYSSQIINIVHGLIILNIITMLYPSLAKEFDNNIEIAKVTLANYINLTMLVIIPLVFGFIAVGDLIIKILYERGNFNSQNTQQVFLISAILFLSFPFNTIRDYIYRSFYCIGDTKTPSRNSLFIVLVNIIFMILLIPFLGFSSVAVSPVLASIISLILSYKKIQKKIGIIDKKNKIIKTNIGFTINSVIMCLIVLVIRNYLEGYYLPVILELILLVFAGGVLYFTLIYITQKKVIKGMLFKHKESVKYFV